MYERHRSMIQRLPLDIYGLLAAPLDADSLVNLCKTSREWASWCSGNFDVVRKKVEDSSMPVGLWAFMPTKGVNKATALVVSNWIGAVIERRERDPPIRGNPIFYLTVPLKDALGHVIEPGPIESHLHSDLPSPVIHKGKVYFTIIPAESSVETLCHTHVIVISERTGRYVTVPKSDVIRLNIKQFKTLGDRKKIAERLKRDGGKVVGYPRVINYLCDRILAGTMTLEKDGVRQMYWVVDHPMGMVAFPGWSSAVAQRATS